MNETKMMIKYIARAISKKYSIDIDEAYKIVNNSFIVELLNDDIDFATHYNAEYWADEIMNSRIMAQAMV